MSHTKVKSEKCLWNIKVSGYFNGVQAYPIQAIGQEEFQNMRLQGQWTSSWNPWTKYLKK